MNRRGFLRLLATGMVAQTVDIDRLLWVPGAKTIFLPPHRGLSIAQIVATTYPRVLAENRRLAQSWADSAFLRELERQGVIRPMGPPIAMPLVYVPNA